MVRIFWVHAICGSCISGGIYPFDRQWTRGRQSGIFRFRLYLCTVQLPEFNHVTDKKKTKKNLSLISCSFSSPPSFHFASLSIFLSLAYPREGHKLSSIPSQRVLQPDNPAARCPPGLQGAPQRAARGVIHVWEKQNGRSGRDSYCSQNGVCDQARVC